MPSLNPAARYQRRADIHFTELPTGGIALLDAQRSVFHGSNPVGKRIWELFAAPRTLPEVVAVLQEEYAVDPARCQDEVSAFVDRLLEQELLSRCPE